MNIAAVAQTRYATKKFDESRPISPEDFEQIKVLLRLSPSSINSQPWHFVIADSHAGKQRIAKGTEGAYSANQSKIMAASHVILFCAKTDIGDAYLQKITDQEDKDGRFASSDAKQMALKLRGFYADLHRNTLDDVACWAEKQVYLNMGTILLGAGVLGIDAVPIEGVDIAALNSEFGLLDKSLCAVAVIALGYQSDEDFNADLPKSRLPEEDIFTHL